MTDTYSKEDAINMERSKNTTYLYEVPKRYMFQERLMYVCRHGKLRMGKKRHLGGDLRKYMSVIVQAGG